MDDRLLHSFVVAAQVKNITLAADKLCMTQSALSRQIQKLEEQLGVPLLERNGKRIKISAEGEALLARMNDVLAASRQLREGASSLRRIETGMLRVGACSQVIEHYLPPVLSDWRESHPGVEIKITEGSGGELDARLHSEDLQLVINASSFAMVDNVEEIKIGSMHLTAIGVPALLPRSNEAVDFASLSGEPMLLLNKSHVTRKLFDAASQLAGTLPAIALESSSPHTLISFAAGGLGIAITPSATRSSNLNLVQRPVMLEGKLIEFSMSAMWLRKCPVPDCGRRFVDVLKARIAASAGHTAASAGNLYVLQDNRAGARQL